MGIEIITAADYVSLGQRTHALLEVLPTVASMGGGKYAVVLAQHLVDNKLRHWEQVRAASHNVCMLFLSSIC